MEIGKYTLEFTHSMQVEFVDQNEQQLIKEIKCYISDGDDHMYACQQLADRIYDDYRISIDTGLLMRLGIGE